MIAAIARRLRLLKREDGFTLTELLVVIPVLSIVLGGISGAMVTLMHWNDQNTEQLTQQQTIRPVLTSMMNDIRSAMPPSQGGLAVLSATSSQIVFYSPDDIAATTGVTSPFHLREVAYRFSGGALQKQVLTSTNTYTTVISTTPWGSWTSASGNFPVSTFPVSTGWTTILGTGLTSDGSDPAISGSFVYYDAADNVLSSPVSTANLQILRTVEVDVTSGTGGEYAQSASSYSNTATIRETQPTS
jgi:prepilin-type N-terminal cleavage/methylation domain-containing protein